MRLNTLIFSDLHLGDKRKTPEIELIHKEQIASAIRKYDVGLLLDLGDSVSKPSMLRENEDYFDCFDKYLTWRKTLGVPVYSCAIDREYDFFEKVTGQPMDCCALPLPGLTLITLAPRYENGHTFTADQIDFLENSLENSEKRVLIGTHVPYPGSCSRPVTPGVFLGVPGLLRMMLENCGRELFWAGGHFHWAEEPPVKTGGLTSFIAGRFTLDIPEKTTYMTLLTADGELVRLRENV